MILTHLAKTREQVFLEIASNPYSTASEIHRALLKKGNGVSEQAVFQELRALLKAEVILKHASRYVVSLDWSLKLLGFAEGVVGALGSSSSLQTLLGENRKKRTWHFQRLGTLKQFWTQLVAEVLRYEGARILLSWNPSPWFYSSNPGHQMSMMSVLRREGAHMYKIIGHEFPFSSLETAVWDPALATYSSNESIYHEEENHYFSVVGSKVIDVYLDKRTMDFIHERFSSRALKVRSKKVVFLSELGELRGRFSLSLSDTPRRADKIRRYFCEYFGFNSSENSKILP